MKNICIGDKFQIHCYKHNGQIHRAWDEAIVLEVCKDYIVFGNEKTRVTEKEGNVWKTKEPAIMYFFFHSWFNVISQLKKDGTYYYCNVASPFIIEEGTIKYIDYDLDLRIFPSGDFKILDKLEYNYHKKLMSYSDELDLSIKNGLNELIEKYKNKEIMFDEIKNMEYYKIYKKIIEDERNSEYF